MTPEKRYNYSPRRKDGKIDNNTNAICEVYSFGKIYWSYAEEIGVEMGGALIATGRRWSRTTSIHQSYMRRESNKTIVVLEHEDFRDFINYLHKDGKPSFGKFQKVVAQALLSAR